MNDLISVITPAHNSAGYIAQTLDSVIAQTYTNWELIVIDDCSTDDTADIVKAYIERDKRIRLIRAGQCLGAAAARNEGIRSSRGGFIAFLDSDDLWMPEKLEKQLSFMRSSGCLFSYTGYHFLKNGIVTRPVRIPAVLTYGKLLGSGNPIGCLTVVINKKAGPVVMPKTGHEDYAAWLAILKTGIEARGLSEDLAACRKHAGALSSNKLRSACWTWKIYRKSEQLSFFRSVICFSRYVFFSIAKYLGKG